MMSHFLQQLNKIRTNRIEGWLTASQRMAMDRAVDQLRISSVNLYGRTGSGKTFLAWSLAERLTFPYLTHPRQLDLQDDHVMVGGVVIDNCTSARIDHREILKELSLRQIPRAVLVSRKPIEDYGYHVQINCTEADLLQVQENLASIGIVTVSNEAHHLWALLNPF